MSKSESKQEKHPRAGRRALHFSTYVSLGVVALGTWGMQVALAGKVAPNTFALNSNVSFEDAAQVQEDLRAALVAYAGTLVTVEHREQIYTFTWEELGIFFDVEATVASLPIITETASPWTVEGGLLGAKEVTPLFDFNEAQFDQTLRARIIDLELPVQEPRVVWNDVSGGIEILQESEGWSADTATFLATLNAQIATLDSTPLTLPSTPIVPRMAAAALEPQKESLQATLTQTTTLFTTVGSWELNWLDQLDWLTFEPTLTADVNGQFVTLDPAALDATTNNGAWTSAIDVHLDPVAFETYLSETLAPTLEVAPQDVTILQAEDGTITFEGTAVDGTTLQREVLHELVEKALNEGWSQVEIPLEFTPGNVNIPDALRELGITELVATGYSEYDGSPTNRRHNIAVGIERFDGVLILPGEEFSFGEQLGQVDASTGYKPELVIKQEGTIPEYGGGICQVSSTLYRAVLFSGLPVVERFPHSYAVGYYAYPMGYGLDATVYPPQVDLVFKNDMDTAIVVQAYVGDSDDAYFKFYGTKDGRTVRMDGPVISGGIGAPPAVYIMTADLPAGTIQKKDSAHNGFTATWVRTITYPAGHPLHPDGATVEETIESRYRAWAAKYAVGLGTEGFDENGKVE